MALWNGGSAGARVGRNTLKAPHCGAIVADSQVYVAVQHGRGWVWARMEASSYAGLMRGSALPRASFQAATTSSTGLSQTTRAISEMRFAGEMGLATTPFMPIDR